MRDGSTYWHGFMVGTDSSHLAFTSTYQIVAEYKRNNTIYYLSLHLVNPAKEDETRVYNG
jgi:hypothetical protein